MPELRKKWQDFKKKHPDFEKNKSFKSDVGPMLDKFDKSREGFSAARDQMEKVAGEVFTVGKSVAAALKGYEAVVKQMAATDKTVEKDFAALDFDDFEGSYVQQYDPKKLNLP